MAGVMASNVPDGLLKRSIKLEAHIATPNCGQTIYTMGFSSP